ncbi:MAG: AIR synthase related protein, partial [Dehalococcoidia bacterium]
AGREQEVARRFERWGLHAAVIGTVTDTDRLVLRDGAEVVADLPLDALVDPPQYTNEVREPEYLARVQAFDPLSLPLGDPNADLLDLIGSPNIASRRPVFRQYDHQVLNNTAVPPGAGDGAVLRIKGTKRGIALSIDGNGRHCYLDPFAGGAMAVAEAARNVVCAGGEPVAMTNCLNFGNPERPEVYYQLARAIAGMAEACRVLETPVVSGNVSLYNESDQGAIYPTPVVGALGVLPDVDHRLTADFKQVGDVVLLLGELGDQAATLGGSEWLDRRHGLVAGRVSIDLAAEAALQRAVLEAARGGLLHSAHDCADGGLAVALAECCVLGGQGLHADLGNTEDLTAALFGEAPSRIVVSCAPELAAAVLAIAAQQRVPARRLGTVGGDRLSISTAIDLTVESLRDPWENGLARAAGLVSR